MLRRDWLGSEEHTRVKMSSEYALWFIIYMMEKDSPLLSAASVTTVSLDSPLETNLAECMELLQEWGRWHRGRINVYAYRKLLAAGRVKVVDSVEDVNSDAKYMITGNAVGIDGALVDDSIVEPVVLALDPSTWSIHICGKVCEGDGYNYMSINVSLDCCDYTKNLAVTIGELK